MTVSYYCLLICITVVAFSQGVFSYLPGIQAVSNGTESLSKSLGMDKAYLLVRNTNYSDNIMLLGNVVGCENCDYEEVAVVRQNSTVKRKISTKYAYDFQVRTSPSNKSLQCQVSSYKFAEHGTYLFEIIQTDVEDRDTCSITQIGDSGHYWTPVIVGILVFVGFVVFVQVWRRFHQSRCVTSSIASPQSINNDRDPILPMNLTKSGRNARQEPGTTEPNDDVLQAVVSGPRMTLVESTRLPNNTVVITKGLANRLRSLDTFRGFSLMMMIFVNYGGGGYWFFDHSSLAEEDGYETLKDLRILSVLQRLALCYFFTALIVLAFSSADDEPQSTQWSIGKRMLALNSYFTACLQGSNVHQPMRIELTNTVLQFWPQWLLVSLITLTWILITFFLEVPHCPKGYLGPGGKHEHGKYQNCTGGAAGYIDRVVLKPSHMYNDPTCKEIYQTIVPYDPEGIMGNLTGILLCYLGVQAGHSFVHSTRVRRVCAYWLVLGIICGSLGLLLSKGGHSDSWIPINKNLWSLTFVLVIASLAYFILITLYLVVDIYQWFTGAPFLWLGMNSIVIYVCHGLFSRFPAQFDVDQTHAKQLAMNLYGSFFWAIVAGLMYSSLIAGVFVFTNYSQFFDSTLLTRV